MEIIKVIKVPNVTWESVCFSKAILDHAMKGVNRKSSMRYGLVGNRNITVAKSRVEYVMCPDIFQKNVIIVITVVARKRTRATLETSVLSSTKEKINIIPKSTDIVTKYGGLSSLLVNS